MARYRSAAEVVKTWSRVYSVYSKVHTSHHECSLDPVADIYEIGDGPSVAEDARNSVAVDVNVTA